MGVFGEHMADKWARELKEYKCPKTTGGKMKDWRINHYPSTEPCVVCGKSSPEYLIGTDSRFGYDVCEEHSKLPPTEIHNKKEKKYDN